MPSTVINRVPLGASTLNRKWYVDLDSATSGPATYIGLFGVTELKFSRDPNLEDDSDFDGGGAGSKTKTGESWKIEGKVARKVTAASATAYNPGQELLRTRSLESGPANSVGVRIYEVTPNGPQVEAYTGRGAVTWTEDGGKNTDLSSASFTIEGQGPLVPITHPATT